MTLSPTDRTNLNNLSPNLVPNAVADSNLRLLVFQEIYEYLDAIISDSNAAQAAGTVTSAKLANGSVITAKIADSAVTGAKVADGAIVTLKLADGAVTSVKITDLAVTAGKLADLAVTRAKIALGAVGADQLDPALLENYGDIAVQAKFAQVDASLLLKAAQSDLETTNANVGDNASDILNLQSAKADITYVDDQIATIGNASPKGVYATTTDLETDFPTGTTGIYVVTADGNWYYWDGSAWTSGGTYQSTGVADGSIGIKKTDFISISENLFDKDSSLQNKQVTGSGSDMYTLSDAGNSHIWASPIIEVLPSTTYTVNSKSTSSGVSVVGFKDDGTYNAGITGTLVETGVYSITTPSVVHFIRFTFSDFELNQDTFMFVEGTTLPTEYVAFYHLLDEELIKPTIARVTALENEIDSGSLPTLHVPLNFDFIVGTIGEIFDFGVLDFDNFPIDYSLNLESSGSWGLRHSNGRFRLDFTASTKIAITKHFHLDDVNDGTRLAEATTVINVVDVISNPDTAKNIVIMGDSFVAFGDILSAFDARMHTDYGLSNYQFVGSKSKNGIKHEGVAGFDWSNFTDNSSIFYNSDTSELDFALYMDTYCAGVNLDYMICIIGVNDFSNGHTIDEVETMATTFFNQLAADYPDCKVILVGQHRQPYASYFNGDTFGVSKGKYMIQLNELYYNLTQSLENVSYVDMMAQFDYDNGFALADESIGRYATETKKYITDTTHPSASVGAKYYADGILAGFFAINQPT